MSGLNANSIRVPPNRRRQCGQSLVEVCVACIALVPLAIGLIYIGQYIHIKHTVQQAAREAAWDAAVAPSVFDPSRQAVPAINVEQTRLRARYFGDAASPVRPDSQVPASFVDPLLMDYSGQQLLQPGSVKLSEYSDDKTPGVEGIVDEIFGKISRTISGLPFARGGEFPPDPKGYLIARVDAKTAKAAHFVPFDTLDLDFHSQTVLLADAWNADGAGERDTHDTSYDTSANSPIPGRTVVNAMPPSAALLGGGFGSSLTKVFNFVGKLPIINVFFPMDGLNFGRAAPDVVPYDKLKPYKE